MATLVYEGPKEWTQLTGYGGDEWVFEKDVPREVPDDVAALILGNNPEPWQYPSGSNRFRKVEDKPTGKSRGGDR